MWYRVLTQYQFLMQDLDTGEVLTRQYGSVINACGHHWDPLWPELKGDYKGELSHAHAYRSPKPFEGKRVCIIGGGNSGTTCLPRQLSASPDFLLLDQLLITGAAISHCRWVYPQRCCLMFLLKGFICCGIQRSSVKFCKLLPPSRHLARSQACLLIAGMDIASEVAQSGATRTLLSCRRPVHVVPRYIFGKPADAQLKPWYSPCTSRAVSFSCNRRKESSADITSCKALGACCRL